MIELQHVHLDLPGFSLEDIHLHVRKHDFFALIGPTGSGKSLLLEGIMGLMPFTRGRVMSEGRDITRTPVEKRQLALVYQDFALFPHLTVTQNILYGASCHRLPGKEAKKRLDFLVSALGLEQITQRYPRHLSGGEKQRTALARCLILIPAVLLLDEPLSALDPVFHDEARQLLKTVHEQMKMTIVMVSHNFDEVLFLANRGAIIHQGRIMQQGDIRTLFQKPVSRFTAGFVGMKNILPFDRHGHGIHLPGLAQKIHSEILPEPGHRYMGIRPEEVVLDTSGGNGGHANRFSGEIVTLSSHGVFLSVRLKTGDQVFEAIWPRSHLTDHGIAEGAPVSFAFHDHAVHTF